MGVGVSTATEEDTHPHPKYILFLIHRSWSICINKKHMKVWSDPWQLENDTENEKNDSFLYTTEVKNNKGNIESLHGAISFFLIECKNKY